MRAGGGGGGGGASRVPFRDVRGGAWVAGRRPGGSRAGGGGRLLCWGAGGGGGWPWLRACPLDLLLSEFRLCGNSGGGSPFATEGGCR